MNRLARYTRPIATVSALGDHAWDVLLERIARALTDAADERWRHHPGLFEVDPEFSLADVRIGARSELTREAAEVPAAGPVALPAP